MAKSAIGDSCEKREKIVHQQPLRRDVDADRARPRAMASLRPRDARAPSMLELIAAARDAELLQRVDLVLHQRDQRRNDDAHARAAAATGIW